MEKARTKVQWALRGALLIALASQVSFIWSQEETGKADLSTICLDRNCEQVVIPTDRDNSNSEGRSGTEGAATEPATGNSASNRTTATPTPAENGDMETECVSGNCEQVGPVTNSSAEIAELRELLVALSEKVDTGMTPAQAVTPDETADASDEESDDPYVRCETHGTGDNARLASRYERARCLINLISEFDLEKDLYGVDYETSEDFLFAVESFLLDIEADLEEMIMSEDTKDIDNAERLADLARRELNQLFAKAASSGRRLDREMRDELLNRYSAIEERIDYSRERNRIAEETQQAQTETQLLAEEVSAIDNEMVRMALDNAQLALQSGDVMSYNYARAQLQQVDRTGTALRLHDQWLQLEGQRNQLQNQATQGLEPRQSIYDQVRKGWITADTFRLYNSNYNSLLDSIGRIGRLDLAMQAGQNGGTIANIGTSPVIQPGATLAPQFALLRATDQSGFARGSFLLGFQNDPYWGLLNDFNQARMDGDTIQNGMYNSLIPTATGSRIPVASQGGASLRGGNGGLPYRIPQAGQPGPLQN